MASKSSLYRRLYRLKAKQKRIQRLITNLTRRLDHKKYYWSAYGEAPGRK